MSERRRQRKSDTVFGMKRKNFVITISVVCAIALITEIILVIVAFSDKDKKKKDKQQEEPTVTVAPFGPKEAEEVPLTKFKTYGVRNGRRCVVETDYTLVDGQKRAEARYLYDAKGRLIETRGREPAFNERIRYDDDRNDRFIENGYYEMYDYNNNFHAETVWHEDANGVRMIASIERNYAYNSYYHITGVSEQTGTRMLVITYDWRSDAQKVKTDRCEVTWKYENGRIVQRTQVAYYVGGGRKTESVINYAYDTEGRISGYTEQSEKEEVTVTYEYDGPYKKETVRSGNGTEETVYYKDYIAAFSWEKGGGKAERINYRIDGNLPPSASVAEYEAYIYNTYDAAGNKTEMMKAELNPNGQPARCYEPDGSFSREFFYDDRGLCSRIKETRNDGTGETVTERILTFDECGNLLACRVVVQGDAGYEDAYYYDWISAGEIAGEE